MTELELDKALRDFEKDIILPEQRKADKKELEAFLSIFKTEGQVNQRKGVRGC